MRRPPLTQFKWSSAIINFDFYAIDSWDNEKLQIYSADNLIFETQELFQIKETETNSGSNNIADEGTYSYSITPVEAEASSVETAVGLTRNLPFRSRLHQEWRAWI